MNIRRLYLIDTQIQGEISPEKAAELVTLTLQLRARTERDQDGTQSQLCATCHRLLPVDSIQWLVVWQSGSCAEVAKLTRQSREEHLLQSRRNSDGRQGKQR